MTPSEAAILLGHIAAFDRRTVGESDARAWAASLRDVPLDDDAIEAITRFFGTAPKDPDGRRWIEPHHVRSIRAGIRAERIDAAHLLHEAEPDETTQRFLERRRAQIAAAANGLIPPATIRVALEGPPHPSVAKAIAGAVRIVPPLPSAQPPPYVPAMARQALGEAIPRYANRYERWPELAIDCPKPDCRAPARKACKRPSGKELRENTHGARQDAWAARANTDPGSDAR